MLISNVHKSIIVMNSLDTRFSKNVFEAVQKTRSTCFIGSKTTRLHLVVLNPIKHSCSFFKHYEKHRLESAFRTGAMGKITSLVKIKGFGLKEERLSRSAFSFFTAGSRNRSRWNMASTVFLL